MKKSSSINIERKSTASKGRATRRTSWSPCQRLGAITLAGATSALVFSLGMGTASAQLTLTGTNYTQNFDGIGSGLPTGFTGRTSASATSLGTVSTFVSTQTAASSTTAQFANYGSFGQADTSTNRAFGVRQTSAAGFDPGVAFTLQLANTTGLTFSNLSFDLGIISSQARSTTFTIQYGLGANPTSFTTLGTYSDPGAVGFTTETFNSTQLAGINNQSQNVYIRIVALTASSGSGTRDTTGIDNFSLAYTSSAAGNFYFDVNSTTAGSGITNGSTYNFSGNNFNSASDGTGATGAFTSGQTATFSAGADGAGKSYTVNIDTAVSTNGLNFNSGNVTLASGGGSLTLTGASIDVASGATAIISQVIGGTVGLSKIDGGSLTLTGTNTYSGGTTVGGGILSISSDSNLGAATDGTVNGIALSGGTLQTTASFSTARPISGTGGSLDIAPSTLLTSTGTVGVSGLTLTNTGTLDLQAASPSVGALAFTAGGTLTSTTNSTVAITGLTAPTLASTATVNPALTYAGTSSLAVNVGAGGELVLNGTVTTPGLTTSGSLSKSGAGTLDLYGANSGLYRVQVGSAAAATTTTGGTVNINNAQSLGNNQLFLNSGTVNATTDLTSTTGHALAIGISIGGLSGSTTAATPVPYVPAAFSGSNIEFTGASGIYEIASTTNALTVNNTTTLSGVVSTSNFVMGTSGPAKGNGLIVTSTNNGTLILGGTSANTFTDAVIVSGSATLVAAKPTALGASAGVTVNTGGTLLLGGASTGRIGTVPITLAGGTFASGGYSDGAGALTLSSASSINFGAGSTNTVLTFADSSGKTWSGLLMLLNYTDTADAFNFAASTTSGTGYGLTIAQLGELRYTSAGGTTYYGTGFDAMGDVTFTPVPEPATMLGGALLVATAGWSQRRRLRTLLTA